MMVNNVHPEFPRDPCEGQVLRLYHYMPVDYLIDDLENSHLKLSGATEFNDYFDGTGVCMGTPTEDALARHIERLCSEMQVSATLSAVVGRELSSSAMVRSLFVDCFAKQIGEKNLLCSSLLLCLSQPDTAESDILMWSYYADKWHGVRLGFDLLYENHATLDYKGTTPYYLEPVQYLPHRAVIDLSTIKDFDDPTQCCGFFQSVLLTKSQAWRHENEWRLLTTADHAESRDGLCFWKFDPRILRTVDLGPMMSESDKNRFAQIVASRFPNAVVNEALRDAQAYRVNYNMYLGSAE